MPSPVEEQSTSASGSLLWRDPLHQHRRVQQQSKILDDLARYRVGDAMHLTIAPPHPKRFIVAWSDHPTHRVKRRVLDRFSHDRHPQRLDRTLLLRLVAARHLLERNP